MHRRRKFKTMDVILVIVALAALLFTLAMIQIFREQGAIPDTLVTCVFAVLGGECGAMAWIKTNKDKQQDRAWQIEDRERQKTEDNNG